jgi:hypothetical protein
MECLLGQLFTTSLCDLLIIREPKCRVQNIKKHAAKKLLEVMSHYPFVESMDGRFPAIEHSEGPHPCAILFCDVDFFLEFLNIFEAMKKVSYDFYHRDLSIC